MTGFTKRLALFVMVLALLLQPVALVWGETGSQPVGPRSEPRDDISPFAVSWYDGAIQYSNITNCVSIIQGMPYTERGVGTYVGFAADPGSGQPAVGTRYWLHIVIAGLGNSCSGQRAYVDLALPANTILDIDGGHPVTYIYNDGTGPHTDIPQTLTQSSYNPGMYRIGTNDAANAYTWPIPQGRILEIQVPVKTSQAISNNLMQAKVWSLDGNSSPWLNPQQGVWVFNSLQPTAPVIQYPATSTISVTATYGYSYAYLYTSYAGTGYFDRGTTTGYGTTDTVSSISAGSWIVWDDWNPLPPAPPVLQPDTLYHWRFRFQPDGGGAQVVGPDQTFRTLPAGTLSVGNGLAASCTDPALNAALSTGNNISFDCGTLPVTNTLTSGKAINSNVSLDGGNKVVLNGSNTVNHFNVQAGKSLTLTNITLYNGKNTSGGGSIRVNTGGRLTLNGARFLNNQSNVQGGALYIGTGASADVRDSVFNNNTSINSNPLFASHGGAIGNYGTLNLNHSVFISNTAATNGGAIDGGGVLTITNSTFNSNHAGVRGGGINNYWGNWTIVGSSFVGNSSSGYGGAIANDSGTMNIQSSGFISNTASSVGGGIRNSGNLTVTNSTFSGNHANTSGGGIEYAVGETPSLKTLTLLNNTIFNNSAGTTGGNLFKNAVTAVASLKNNIVASGSPNNCSEAVTSQGNNLESANSCGFAAGGDLINTNPLLGPLQDVGGPTWLHPLQSGSPAIDAGTNSGSPATDQRGTSRPRDGNGDGSAVSDIGAYEYIYVASPTPVTPTPVTPTPVTPTPVTSTKVYLPILLRGYSGGW